MVWESAYRARRVLLGVFGALVAAVGVVPASAQASNVHGYFCGTPQYPVLIAAGHRCAHYPPHLFDNLSSHDQNPFASDVMCVVAKANSDGSGGNETPAVCVQPYYSGNAASYCTRGYSCNGYATIIFQSSAEPNNADFFYGYLNAVY